MRSGTAEGRLATRCTDIDFSALHIPVGGRIDYRNSTAVGTATIRPISFAGQIHVMQIGLCVRV